MAGLQTTHGCLTFYRHRLFHHYMQHFLFLGIGIGLCVKCDFERLDPLNPAFILGIGLYLKYDFERVDSYDFLATRTPDTKVTL